MATITTERIEQLLEPIKDAGIDVRLGYIGNLERWGDDRSWRIWVHGIREWRTNNVLALGGMSGTSEQQLEQLEQALERGALDRRIAWAVSRLDDPTSSQYRWARVTDAMLKPIISREEAEASIRAYVATLCEGHPAGADDPMGQTVTCSGICRARQEVTS